MRLIDATRLVKLALIERDKIPLTTIRRYSFGTESPNHHGQSMRGGIRKVLRIIEQAPTIDAMPVVRCKDCAQRSEHGICYKHGHGVSGDFFCAHGVRENPDKKVVQQEPKSGTDICKATGLACSGCVPGPCDNRTEEDTNEHQTD